MAAPLFGEGRAAVGPGGRCGGVGTRQRSAIERRPHHAPRSEHRGQAHFGSHLRASRLRYELLGCGLYEVEKLSVLTSDRHKVFAPWLCVGPFCQGNSASARELLLDNEIGGVAPARSDPGYRGCELVSRHFWPAFVASVTRGVGAMAVGSRAVSSRNRLQPLQHATEPADSALELRNVHGYRLVREAEDNSIGRHEHDGRVRYETTATSIARTACVTPVALG